VNIDPKACFGKCQYQRNAHVTAPAHNRKVGPCSSSGSTQPWTDIGEIHVSLRGSAVLLMPVDIAGAGAHARDTQATAEQEEE
jgi:hypothetical protein